MTFWPETVSLLAAGTVVVPRVAGWFAMQEGFIEWTLQRDTTSSASPASTRRDSRSLQPVGNPVSARVDVKKGDRVRYSDYVLNRAGDDAGVDMPSSFRKLPARLRVR